MVKFLPLQAALGYTVLVLYWISRTISLKDRTMADEKKGDRDERSLSFQSPNSLKGLGEEALWYTKTERIGHALFFIIGQREEERALTERLKERMLDIIEVASFCLKNPGLREEFLVRLLELGTLLRIGSTAGEIGEENARIVSAELAKLSDRVSASVHGGIPSSLFAVSEREEISSDRVSRLRSLTELFEGGIPQGKRHQPQRQTYRTKDMSFNKGLQRHSPMAERSQQILSVVKEKGRVSIKEVSAVIDDCSEKTIQRELATLVQKGLLRKEGQRRWSVYTLA